MIGAALVFFGAVAIGALLRCLAPPPKFKDVYVNGRRIELGKLEGVRWECRIPRLWEAKSLAVVKREDGTREVVEVPCWRSAAIAAEALIGLAVYLDGEAQRIRGQRGSA